MPQGSRKLAEELAEISRILAPEHWRCTYGEPARDLTPWEIYTKGDAEKALQYAKKVIVNTKSILRNLGI